MRSTNRQRFNVEVMGGCGEEVPDTDGLKEEIGLRLLYAIPHLMDVQDLERAVESIYDFMKLRPTEVQRWRPKEGDTYFKIDSDGEIHKVIWYEDDLDRKFWAFGNCFKTAADAYMARKDIKKTLDNFHQHRDS